MNRWITNSEKVQEIKPAITKVQSGSTNSSCLNLVHGTLRNRFPKVLAAATLILFSCNPNASPVSTVNAYIGLAKTLKSTISGFIGETTVTPAFALGKWDHYDYGIYGRRSDGKPNYFGQHLHVERSPVTGEFHYKTSLRDRVTGQWYQVSRDPIFVPRVSRMTWTCVPNPGAPFIYNTLEDFSLQVWATSIRKTGYFPPSAPYTAYLKCSATSMQVNCKDDKFVPRSTTIRSNEILLQDSGYVEVKMPIVQYEYAFPMHIWVGDWKDY